MAMQMSRAFNSKMMTTLYHLNLLPGSYDANNEWVPGGLGRKRIHGVFKSGNRFSQFEEGKALHNMDGGARYSDYRSLHVLSKYGLAINDKVEVKGVYYNILQESPETVFGFQGFILEKTENWKP